MSERVTFHAWGFFDDDGQQRAGDSVAVTEESVHETFQRVGRNVTHFGGEVEQIRTTRTLDGWLVGVEFETPPRDRATHMWHHIGLVSEPWADAPSDEQAAVAATEGSE